MTFRDLLTAEHPEAVGKIFIGGCNRCPMFWGYEKQFPCAAAGYGEITNERCGACWDREAKDDYRAN